MSLVSVEVHDCSITCPCPVGERNRLRAEVERLKALLVEVEEWVPLSRGYQESTGEKVKAALDGNSAPRMYTEEQVRAALATFDPFVDEAEIAIRKLVDRDEWDAASLQRFYEARAGVLKALLESK